MERTLIDTGAIYALLDRADANHAAARRVLLWLRATHQVPFVTNFILAESHALILVRLGHQYAREWIEGLAWPVERATESDEDRARQIILTYDDKGFSYTDAVSFSVLERLGLRRAFAFDRHFEQFGLERIAPPVV